MKFIAVMLVAQMYSFPAMVYLRKTPAQWWQFWLPQSGCVGALIYVAIAATIAFSVEKFS